MFSLIDQIFCFVFVYNVVFSPDLQFGITEHCWRRPVTMIDLYFFSLYFDFGLSEGFSKASLLYSLIKRSAYRIVIKN